MINSDLAFALATGHLAMALWAFIGLCFVRDFGHEGHKDDQEWWMSLAFIGSAMLWEIFLFISIAIIAWHIWQDKKERNRRGSH